MKYNAKRARLEKARKYLRTALGNVMLSEDYAVGFKAEVREIKKELDVLINRMDYYLDNWDLLKEIDKRMGEDNRDII